MEFLNWKNILLEWANRLEFFGRPHYSLNLAEIEFFFNEFKSSLTSANIASKSLDAFMKRYYPQFHLTYNKDGKFCPDDYVYGYSLLMYFSCVTHPQEKMQKICNTMQEDTQLTIKTFLQNLLECNSFTREAIKSVIELSAPAKISDYVLVLSPIKTNEVDICPPTPRTKVLNEWNSENRQLKALVETERYERGFLELQMKKKDEQINVLNQERRKFVTDIQELKSQLSEKDTENIPPNDNAQLESLKRRLRKELTDKEVEIKELENKVFDVTASKQHLAEKFSYVESLYNKAIECTKDLTVQLEEATDNCEKQQQHIKGLEITIKEYQKYFNESSSKGNSLDASSDNLDDSYAIAMANMSIRSVSSPESLSKVVDIQLREQISLYHGLLDKYNQIEEEKARLNAQIEEHSEKTKAMESKCRQIEDENVKHVRRYEDKLEELAALSKESESNLTEFQSLRIEFDAIMAKANESDQEIENLTSAKSLLELQLNASEREVNELRDNNKTIGTENENHQLHIERLQSSVLQLQDQIKALNEREVLLQAEIDRLTRLLDDLHSQMENLQVDHQKLIEDYADSLTEKNSDLEKLEQDRNLRIVELEQQAKLISELTVQIDTTKAKLIAAESLRSDLSSQHEEICRQKDGRLAVVEEEKDSLTAEVSSLKTYLSDAEEIKSKLLTQNGELVMAMEKEKDDLSSEVRILCDNLLSLQARLSAAESLQNELSNANVLLTQDNVNKDNKIEKMIQECDDHISKRDTLQEAVVNLTNQIQSLETERKIISSTLFDVTSSHQLAESECMLLREQLSATEVIRVDLEAQLNQSDEEKEKLFLNLQEKIDEAEANEVILKKITQQFMAEAAKCDILVEKNKSNCDGYESQINELTACKVNLNETIDTLNKEIGGYRENSERIRSDLKKSVEDLQTERDALILRIESAERELVSSRGDLKLKDQQVADQSKVIEQLQSESAVIFADKLNVEADLQKNIDLVMRVTQELELNKADLHEKVKSIDSLSDQIEKLKTSETSMVAESNKFSDELKELADELESVKSSRDNLDLKCISLNDELKAFEDEYKDLENKFVERNVTETSRNAALETEIADLKQQIVEMIEVQLKTNQEEIAAVSKKAEENEIERLAKIQQLQQVIEKMEIENKSISSANEELSNQVSRNKIHVESYQQSIDYKAEIEELLKTKQTLSLRVNDLTCETEKLREDLETARHENVSLTDENIDLATEIEKVRKEYSTTDESNRAEINSLQSEVNRLVSSNAENHQRIEELQKANDAKSTATNADENYAKLATDLQVAMSDLQSKIQECQQAQEIHNQLVNDNRILSAKLTKHREVTSQQEKEWQKERVVLEERSDNLIKENRFELEGKLIKMKEKMKHIYTEETNKAKEKYEKQEKELTHYKGEAQMLAEKMAKYHAHVGSLSKQLYKQNEENLEVKKENEFLKNKLRLAESNPRDSRLLSFGSNFKMEDEEGEIFNNTYLNDLKTGITRTSPIGRESIRQSELNMRNSMAARHLRSTYSAQYGDQNLREEDISMPYFNDSMFSNQLDVRRGTLYQRPGPPTPSKNGGRLSFGGGNVTASELFPKEVLKEQNNNAKTKTTPGKLMSMFSSKHKENPQNPTPKKRLSIFKKKTNL